VRPFLFVLSQLNNIRNSALFHLFLASKKPASFLSHELIVTVTIASEEKPASKYSRPSLATSWYAQ